MSLDKLGGRTQSQGKRTETTVFDQKTHSLLRKILEELKLMNVKLSEMSDLEIEKRDIK
jgi:hypothetical protein